MDKEVAELSLGFFNKYISKNPRIKNIKNYYKKYYQVEVEANDKDDNTEIYILNINKETNVITYYREKTKKIKEIKAIDSKLDTKTQSLKAKVMEKRIYWAIKTQKGLSLFDLKESFGIKFKDLTPILKELIRKGRIIKIGDNYK